MQLVFFLFFFSVFLDHLFNLSKKAVNSVTRSLNYNILYTLIYELY